MKKKTLFSIPILIIGLILLFANSCEKDEPKSAPLINTTAVTEITKTSAISGGNVTNDGGTGVTSRGICWSKNKMPTINDSKTTPIAKNRFLKHGEKLNAGGGGGGGY